MRMEVALLVGPETKAVLADLLGLVERLERAAGSKVKTKAAPVEESEAEETDEFESARPSKKAVASSFDDEDETETEVETEEEEEAPPPKKAAKSKTPKVMVDDVNDAAKAKIAYLVKTKKLSGTDARKKVLNALKKHFDVTSVTELEPSQYADAVKLLS